jgi:hypothetical protein
VIIVPLDSLILRWVANATAKPLSGKSHGPVDVADVADATSSNTLIYCQLAAPNCSLGFSRPGVVIRPPLVLRKRPGAKCQHNDPNHHRPDRERHPWKPHGKASFPQSENASARLDQLNILPSVESPKLPGQDSNLEKQDQNLL